MEKMNGLRSGVAEMRAVARKLNQWADDLEASLPSDVGGSGEKLTLPQVRKVLANKCAAGFSCQVKALIESFGVTSLGEVPEEKYAELLEAVSALGAETGDDPDAG